jgi:hypothetical protein
MAHKNYFPLKSFLIFELKNRRLCGHYSFVTVSSGKSSCASLLKKTLYAL